MHYRVAKLLLLSRVRCSQTDVLAHSMLNGVCIKAKALLSWLASNYLENVKLRWKSLLIGLWQWKTSCFIGPLQNRMGTYKCRSRSLASSGWASAAGRSRGGCSQYVATTISALARQLDGSVRQYLSARCMGLSGRVYSSNLLVCSRYRWWCAFCFL